MHCACSKAPPPRCVPALSARCLVFREGTDTWGQKLRLSSFWAGTKLEKASRSILNLTLFQHNLSPAWDPSIKSFPKGYTPLILKVKQNNIVIILKNEQMEEETGTQLSISILAAEAIMHGVSGPDTQIHPLQLFLSLSPPWRVPRPRGYSRAHLSCFFCPLKKKYFSDGVRTNF